MSSHGGEAEVPATQPSPHQTVHQSVNAAQKEACCACQGQAKGACQGQGKGAAQGQGCDEETYNKGYEGLEEAKSVNREA